jgi:hypothetical protein
MGGRFRLFLLSEIYIVYIFTLVQSVSRGLPPGLAAVIFRSRLCIAVFLTVSYSTYNHNTQIFGLLQAKVAPLVATEGEK